MNGSTDNTALNFIDNLSIASSNLLEPSLTCQNPAPSSRNIGTSLKESTQTQESLIISLKTQDAILLKLYTIVTQVKQLAMAGNKSDSANAKSDVSSVQNDKNKSSNNSSLNFSTSNSIYDPIQTDDAIVNSWHILLILNLIESKSLEEIIDEIHLKIKNLDEHDAFRHKMGRILKKIAMVYKRIIAEEPEENTENEKVAIQNPVEALLAEIVKPKSPKPENEGNEISNPDPKPGSDSRSSRSKFYEKLYCFFYENYHWKTDSDTSEDNQTATTTSLKMSTVLALNTFNYLNSHEIEELFFKNIIDNDGEMKQVVAEIIKSVGTANGKN